MTLPKQLDEEAIKCGDLAPHRFLCIGRLLGCRIRGLAHRVRVCILDCLWFKGHTAGIRPAVRIIRHPDCRDERLAQLL
jgi:hypothetical protein